MRQDNTAPWQFETCFNGLSYAKIAQTEANQTCLNW